MKYDICAFVIVLFTIITLTQQVPLNSGSTNEEDNSDLLKSFIHYLSDKIQQYAYQNQVSYLRK